MNLKEICNSKKTLSILWESVVLGILLIFAASIFLWQSYAYNLNGDEREHLATTRMIYAGMIPYRDFFQHHHPLMWYMSAPLLAIWGNSAFIFYILRVFMLLSAAGTIWYTYKTGRILGLGCQEAVWSVIIWLAFPIVLTYGVEFRPDNWMMTFLMVGVAYFFIYLKEKRPVFLQVSFVWFFISFLCLQKAVFFLAPLGIVCLWLLYKKELPIVDLAKAAALPFFLTAGVLFCLYLSGDLKDYFELNWLLNLKIDGTSHLHTDDFYVFWAAAMAAIWVMYRHKRTDVWIFCFLYLATAGQMLLHKPWFGQYLLLYYPFVAIIFAFVLADMRRFSVYVLFLLAMGLLLIWQGITMIDRCIHSRLSIGGANMAYARYILENTAENDLILDDAGDYTAGLRLPASGYYWYSYSHMSAMDNYYFDRQALPDMAMVIEIVRPKMISISWWRNCLIGDDVPFDVGCSFWKNVDFAYLNEHYNDMGFVYVRKN